MANDNKQYIQAEFVYDGVQVNANSNSWLHQLAFM